MTPDPEMKSWIPVPDGSDFPIQNLPYGVFTDATGTRCGVAIGDAVLDLARAESAGLFENTGLDHDTFRAVTLNPFLNHARGVWSMVRSRITDVLSESSPNGEEFCRQNHLIVEHPVAMRMPIDVGDYVDFYSSEHHATNVGRIFRPDGAPLLPNWRHLPVAYHGRAGTVVVSGTDIHRPHGQKPGQEGPRFGATDKLDFELEVGFIVGQGHELGTPTTVEDAEHHIFGMVLVNDWSARDVQAWEYVPLGPFLGKSFATTISPWIVPLEALEPFRTEPPTQDPEPMDYLRSDTRRGFEIDLGVALTPAGSDVSSTICKTSFASMYWTVDQQLAHATVNGATARPGDLFASGTVSGPTRDQFGSLLESTWNGTDPLTVADGSIRTFLKDGDTVTITGSCSAPNEVSIGFGTCDGTIVS